MPVTLKKRKMKHTNKDTDIMKYRELNRDLKYLIRQKHNIYYFVLPMSLLTPRNSGLLVGTKRHQPSLLQCSGKTILLTRQREKHLYSITSSAQSLLAHLTKHHF